MSLGKITIAIKSIQLLGGYIGFILQNINNFSNTKKRQTDSLAYSDKFLIFAKVNY